MHNKVDLEFLRNLAKKKEKERFKRTPSKNLFQHAQKPHNIPMIK